MIIYRVRGFPDLLDKPGGTALPDTIGSTVAGTGNFQGDFVEVSTGTKTGWLSKDVLEVKDRDTLNEEAFVRECIIAERTINALPQTKPWFVAADYVIARAIFESQDATSKLVNAGNKIPGSDAVGPLQVSSAEWQRFDNGGSLPASEGSRYLSARWAAAFDVHRRQGNYQGQERRRPGSTADPPLPNYLKSSLPI